MTQLKNERGETLVTVVISAVLLLIIAVVAAPTLLATQKVDENRTVPAGLCREVATNVINAMRSNGIQSHYYTVNAGSGIDSLDDKAWQTGARASNPDPVQPEVGVVGGLETERFPAQKPIYWDASNSRYQMHSPLLIHSAVNSLQTIYNAWSNQACTSGLEITDTNPLRSLHQGSQVGKFEVRTFLHVRPFDWASGQILPCAPLRVRPFAKEEPPMATRSVSGQPPIIDISAYDPNYGFEMEVQAQLTSVDGEQVNCVVKDRFQFDPLINAPAMPEVSESGDATNREFTFTNSNPGGTHMVCSASWRAVWWDGFIRRSSSTTETGWVPCDRLQVCGRPGTNTIHHSRDQQRIVKRVSVRGTPDHPGAACDYSVKALSFDVVGNVSADSTLSCRGTSCSGAVAGIPSDGGGGGGGSRNGYEVDGVQFADYSVARKAAEVTGGTIRSVGEVTNPMDARFNSVNSGKASAATQNATATTAAATATAALASTTAAAGGIGKGTSAAGARSAATAAGAAASTAASAASAARAAATEARSAATAAAANNTSSLGSVGLDSVAQAEQAAAEAEKAAEEAEKAAAEAARLAEEAKREAEEKERAESEAASKGGPGGG